MRLRCAALVVTMSAIALANSAPGPSGESEWRSAKSTGGVWLTGPSPLEVDHETLRVTCREDDHKAYCAYDATYALVNPAAERVEARGAFYGDDRAEIDLGGANAAYQDHHPGLWDFVRSLLRLPDPTEEPEHTAFQIALDGGARRELRFRGSLDPVDWRGTGSKFDAFVPPAYVARHPLLYGATRGDRFASFQYLVYPLRAWKGARKLRVEIRFPASWDYARPALDGAPAFDVKREDATRVATVDADGASAGTLQLSFAIRGTTIVNGGPFVGVGGQTEPGDIRLRAGWEIAGPEYMSYSIAAETNAKDRFLVAAVAEASLPNILFLIPAIGLGAGPVVGGGPRGAYGGARVQPMFSWPFLSLVIPIDVIAPSFTGGKDPLVNVALIGQLSL